MRKVLTISIVLLQIMSGVYAQTEITTAEQFRQMKTDGNYILMSDIDLSTKPFVPIGGYNGYFSGTFDGNGHTITIGGISSSLDFYYRGLFAKIASEGVVKNLIVKGSVDNSEESASWVGAIAGANYGTIINCVSYAYVNSSGILNNTPKSHTTGGIAGVNGGTISYCLVSEKIMGSVWSSGTGGIVGSDSYENTGKIENCIYAADGISVPTNYSGSAMIDAYGMICGDTDGGRGANRTKNCYYIENGTFSGFGDRWGKDVPDDSRCYGLNVDGIRSLVGEGGIYASTEYDIFRNSILKAIAPEWYQNIDTYLTDGYFTFYNGDCNYSVYNNETIYTGIIKNSKVILTALDGTIIPKGVPVVIKSNTRYCSLRKSYKEVSCTCENDLLGADTDISCQSNSNYVLSLENGNAGFRMFSGTTIKANTAYIPWQEDIDDCDFLPIIIRGLSPAITFADAKVKALCVANWDADEDGELSEAEAAVVTYMGNVFAGKDIISFDELQYFTGLTSLPSFRKCKKLTSIVIPEGITTIPTENFEFCSSLANVSMSNSVKIINKQAFKDCTNLDNVIIPDNVTYIGEEAFEGCNLTSVTIPNSVTSIGDGAFSFCSGLTSITIPNSVTSIGIYAFSGCSSLTSITVKEGNNVFDSREGCNAIIKTSSNTLIASCQNTVIPNSVTCISTQAFKYCSGLTSLTIPNSVTSIGSNAFYGCSDLTSVVSKIEEPFSFGSEAFYIISSSCTLTIPAGKKEAYIAAGWTESVFKGGIVEAPAPSPNITFADANVKALCVENWDTNGDGELSEDEAATVTNLGTVFRTNKEITSFNELQYFTGLTSISNGAFSGCSNLISVIMPDGIETIGDYAFFSCKGLNSLALPNSVTSIGNYAFEECHSLQTLVIPASVTSIGVSAFGYCDGLTSIKVEEDNLIYDSRDNCNAIIQKEKNILITGCLNTNIPTTVRSIGQCAFRGCSGLTSVNIPSNIIEIGGSAFMGCANLETLMLPATISSIGGNAFWDCNNLVSVVSERVNPIVLNSMSPTFTSSYNRRVLTIPYGTKNAYIAAGWTEDVFKGGIFEAAPDPSLFNTLAISDAEVCKGGSIVLPVNMSNTEPIKGVQFDLTLPNGVTVATDAYGELGVSLTSRAHSSHSVSARQLSNGDYRIVVTSMGAKTFNDTEGKIMNITLNVAGNVEMGEYDIKVSSIALNTADNVTISPADVTATLTVTNAKPGDVNGDGSINVTDVGMVIDDILENTPANFSKAAADVNGDNVVNVTDAGLIIDIILSDGAFAKERGVMEDMLDPQ